MNFLTTDMNFLTITAIDKHSSDMMNRTFSATTPDKLKEDVEEWEKEIPYRRYELTTNELVSDYPDGIEEALDELEVTY